MRNVVLPCLICGAPVRGSNRCPEHKKKDTRPTLKKRVSRSLSTRLRRQALYRDRWTCQSCGLKDRTGRQLEADHKVRLADGGEHDLNNLQILCKPCHFKKTMTESKRTTPN